MSGVRELIIELGTEELPAVGLTDLAKAFNENLCAGFRKQGLEFSSSHFYVTPRRLAVHVLDLVEMQKDRVEVRRGPSVDSAFDKNGKPTRAATGFASSCNVSVDQLETIDNGKGKWLGVTQNIQGKKTLTLLEQIISDALANLPIKKRMRWGCHEFDFVRPVHWLLVIFGNEPVKVEIMNLVSGNLSYGHRFLSTDPIVINKANEYKMLLEKSGKVLVDFAERKSEISRQIQKLAKGLKGQVLENDTLLDEVTGLVEWPVALAGNFNKSFLDLPVEVLIATMEKHQKSFALQDRNGQLLPYFISVSNLESREPAQVVKGNEKVLQPRLSDAAFFWKRDLTESLMQHGKRLSGVLYQETLGTMADKTVRITALAAYLADMLGFDPDDAKRASVLCKCDLVTEMVGEFPELQGTMGKYYAHEGNEKPEIATAIEEHYRPRFSGDQLPDSDCGQIVAIADRLETLVGIFSIAQSPSGDKDPFGLRRSALGVLRILIEKQLNLDLLACLQKAASLYEHDFDADKTVDSTFDYILDRLRKYYLDQNIENHIFDSVFVKRPARPLDFDLRIRAVMEFNRLPEAESLSSANKRISNILKQTDIDHNASIDKTLFSESAERDLFENTVRLEKKVDKLVNNSEYRDALKLLSGLQTPIDAFFDNVLVMDEDNKIRKNRIALLKSVSDLFMGIADVSKLSISK